MSEPKLDKGRIARNTGILYIRMLVLMLVSLYTSRITLEALGVDNFGVFNIVGGTIGMLSIVTSALSTAISRFTTFELGKPEPQLQRIFCISMTIQLVLSLVVVIIGESVGVWFVNNELNIPAESMPAANFIFQITIITLPLGLINTPYSAIIIANERMAFFAWMSVFDVVGKLAVSYFIFLVPMDQRLFWFSGFWGLIGLLTFLLPKWYCNRHFPDSRYRWIWHWPTFKQMFGFAGWNVIGSTAAIFRDLGGNIVINMFCGPAVNAARGIATQVTTAVGNFTGNFTMALNPQITKSYAMGETAYTNSLISQGARFTIFLMLVISFPILFNTGFILSWWLKEVPDKAVVFVQLALIFSLVESLSRPLITLMLATGRIMWYQIVVGGAQFINVPLSYLWLLWGGGAECVLIVAVGTSVLCLILRLVMLHHMIGFSIKRYSIDVCKPVVTVVLLSIPVPLLLTHVYEVTSFAELVIESVPIALSTGLIGLYVGCTAREREVIFAKMKQIYRKFVPLRRVND